MKVTSRMEYDEVHELMKSLCRKKDWQSVAIHFICLGDPELVREDSLHHEANDFLEERVEKVCEMLKFMDVHENNEGRLGMILFMVYRTIGKFLDQGGVSSATLVIDASDIHLLSIPSSELIQFTSLVLGGETISEDEIADLTKEITRATKYGGEFIAPSNVNLSSRRKVHDFWDSVLKSNRITSTTLDEDEVIGFTDSITSSSGVSIDSQMMKSKSFNVDPETVEKISSGADMASEHIYKAAVFFQNGMKNYIVPNVNKGVEVAGEFVKQNTSPAESEKDARGEDSDDFHEKKKSDDSNLDEMIAFTDASVGATDKLRVGAKSAMFGLRDFSTRKINDASEVWKEKQIGKQIIPDDDAREVAIAAGKVGIAALAASAMFVETMFEATSEVAKKSVCVASDVTTHTHGQEAGKVVKNTGVAAGNLLRTMTHVGAFEAGVMTKVVARNAAKVNMTDALDRPIEGGVSADEEDENSQVPVISAKE